MPAGTRLTYGTLTLHSSEIVKFSYSREFKIVTTGTVSLTEITQPGNLSPVELNVEVMLRDYASTKFNQWTSKLGEKSIEALSFTGRNWGGNFYLTNVEADCEEFDDNGDILRISMRLRFLGNQNFG